MKNCNKRFLRMCISCRERKPKVELLRVALLPNKTDIIIDSKIDGRGAYICKSGECIDKAIKKRGLNRAFKKQVSENIYTQIRGLSGGIIE